MSFFCLETGQMFGEHLSRHVRQKQKFKKRSPAPAQANTTPHLFRPTRSTKFNSSSLKSSFGAYHIDYCFASTDISDKVESVEVGTYDKWIAYSDHAPLIVNIAL